LIESLVDATVAKFYPCLHPALNKLPCRRLSEKWLPNVADAVLNDVDDNARCVGGKGSSPPTLDLA
jgi:hypothetical protein